MTLDRLGDMRLFVEAAALGGLSAAGRKLGLSPVAASARLLKLEKSLTARPRCPARALRTNQSGI
jgi:DNA-binding transcriptional LysR family regulator